MWQEDFLGNMKLDYRRLPDVLGYLGLEELSNS
jgi:hypothetical protein